MVGGGGGEEKERVVVVWVNSGSVDVPVLPDILPILEPTQILNTKS